MTAATTAPGAAPAAEAKQLAAAAARHARVRWAGAPLLLSGAAQIGWALVSLGSGGAFWNIMLALFGCGLGLASFGANHDTAMALAQQSRRAGATAGASALGQALSTELDQEIARDRDGTMALRASPKVALGIPVVAVLVQALSAWQLLNL